MVKDVLDLITMTEEQFLAYIQKAGVEKEVPKS